MRQLSKDFRRVVASLALLVACPLYVLCGLRHVCMAGHMQHPPYPVTDIVLDAVWVGAFLLAGVLSWKSNFHLRRMLVLLVVLLLSSRLLLGSGGGILFIVELPVLLILLIVSVRNLFGGAKDWDTVPLPEKRAHRRKVLRRWAIALAVMVGAGLLAWGGTELYWFVRRATTPRVQVASVPFSRDFVLKAGDAYVFELPNGKTVAVWCENRGGIARAVRGHDLDISYGEKPFQTLEYERIPLPEGNGYTSGDLISYIRSSGTTESGDEFEYVLYVGEYRIGLKEKGVGDDGIPLVVTVRQATEKEQLHGHAERAHYMNQLSSPDPQKRLEAVHELSGLVFVGSRYAGDPGEVVNAIRPLLKDPDSQVRKKVLDCLRSMGDEDSLLEMLTPRPADEYLQPNWGWTIAGWAKKDSERVPKQVLSYFETDDPRLHEFALAFFSCYRLEYFAAQPHVARLLKSPLPAVRAAAASAIRSTCDEKQAVELLRIALDDTSDSVLVEALKQANWFHGSIPVERLTRHLGHKNPEVREKATYALDCCRSPQAVEPLLAATHDINAKVRAQAAVSLGRVGDAKAYSRLLEMLSDKDAEVRESAVNGLRWLGKAEAIPAIEKLQDDDPNESVRQMAGRTVSELHSKQ